MTAVANLIETKLDRMAREAAELKNGSGGQLRYLRHIRDMYAIQLAEERRRTPARTESKSPNIRSYEATGSRLGIQPDSVRRMIKRLEHLEIVTDTGNPIDTLGAQVDKEWLGQVNELKETLDDLRKRIAATLVIARRLEAADYPEHTEAIIVKHLRSALFEIRRNYPDAVCPQCRGLRGACLTCSGFGWVSVDSLDPTTSTDSPQGDDPYQS